MGIVTEYLKYQEEYQNKYGDRTIVLMEVGSFWEMYEFDPEKDPNFKEAWPDKRLGHAVELSKLLGYVLTKRNKNKPYTITNPNMIGFPCVAYEKHSKFLLSKNYTIVVIEQDKPGKNAERTVTKVLSPATEISDLSPIPVTNQIVSIYIEVQKEEPKFEDFLITVGVSTIDVTTGENIVSEIYSKQKDAIYAIQEIYRFLISVVPRELIVHIKGISKDRSNTYKKWITSNLNIDSIPIYNIRVNDLDPEFTKSIYHQQFLSKLFHLTDKKNILENNTLIIEELGLERIHYGTISYIILLQYCYEHNQTLIEKIHKPDTGWVDQSKHLIITHNGIKQLDILPQSRKGIDSLLSVIDFTTTSMGKRFLRQMICNPITDPIKINQYYNMIEDILNSGICKQLDDSLRKICDLERYQRKLRLKIIKPNEFVTLFRSYIEIVKLYTLILSNKTTLNKILFKQVNEFNQCIHSVLSKYNLDNLYYAKIEANIMHSERIIFYPGTNELADKYKSSIKQYENKICCIIKHLNSFLSKTRGKLIEYSSKKGKSENNMALFTTLHKGKIVKESQVDRNICGEIQVITVNKEAMITSDVIAQVCSDMIKTKKKYNEYIYRCYHQTVYDISENTFFSDVNRFITELDYIKSNVKSVVKNNYHRPIILDESETSHLEIKNLRHPIIEKIIDNEYITNDLTIGKNPTGILLYGSNSTGKSSLVKAVGLNIIMAQAGMYVPSNLKYVPYNRIITRLSGEDDLLGGKSSFVVEMTELRTILRNADSKSLVLGDELCRGSEAVSGTSLTIATLVELVQRKSSFIFSTHMHNLTTNDYILKLKDKLCICHLSLRCENNTLIYDRKLKDGPGDSIYGLEVAKSLSIDPSFIEKAVNIRKTLIDHNYLLNPKRSNYNKNVYMDSCAICGKTTERDLQTHHIKEQSKSNINGFIEHFHKDSSFNLIILCDNCHKKLHSDNMNVITEQTIKGKIVKFDQ
uniref:DNA mismatch repair ATPase n=1 Tax=Pithovirus LCPAC302 TaxID=2506593 RepID=A0A481ZAF2_9VIRU|nr:MAG: DNA mismatch repair ATPase [Pithovirus LCPAC302]